MTTSDALNVFSFGAKGSCKWIPWDKSASPRLDLQSHRLTLSPNRSTPERTKATEGWDCLPRAVVTDHQSFLAYRELLHKQRLTERYDLVCAFLPEETSQILGAKTPTRPQSLIVESSVKTSSEHRPNTQHVEPASLEALLLAFCSPKKLVFAGWEFDWPFGPPSAVPLFSPRPSTLPLFPKANEEAFVFFPEPMGLALWVEALVHWAEEAQKNQPIATPSPVQQTLLRRLSERFAHKRVLFACGVPTFLGITGALRGSLEDPQRASLHPLGQGREVSHLAEKRQKKETQVRFFRTSARTDAEFAAVPTPLVRELEKVFDQEQGLSANQLLKKSLENLILRSVHNYEEWTHLNLSHKALQNFQCFLWKWLRRDGRRCPRAFDLVLAARNCVDGNFSFELSRVLQSGSEQNETEGGAFWSLPEKELRLSDFEHPTLSLELNSFATFEHIRQRGGGAKKKPPLIALPQEPLERVPSAKRAVSESDFPDSSWTEDREAHHCSFPQEDLFLDETILGIQRSVQHALRERQTRYEPLQLSLEDGLDIRETLRHWHQGQIYVRAQGDSRPLPVGSVVFEFTASPDEERHFDWQALWTAEAHDATHLMFYATDFSQEVIGPGIARSEFGGFAAIPADRWMVDLWHHPYLRAHARSKGELLLLAAGFASAPGTLVHIGHRRPRETLRRLLAQNQRSLIHKPLSGFDSNKVRKLKTFHVLAEAGVRNYAQKHIRKDET